MQRIHGQQRPPPPSPHDTLHTRNMRGAGMTGSIVGQQATAADLEECEATCTADAVCLDHLVQSRESSRCRLSSASTVLISSCSLLLSIKLIKT